MPHRSQPTDSTLLPLSYMQGDAEAFHIPNPRRPVIIKAGRLAWLSGDCCLLLTQPWVLQTPCRVPDSPVSQGPRLTKQRCPCRPFSAQAGSETGNTLLSVTPGLVPVTFPRAAEKSFRECGRRPDPGSLPCLRSLTASLPDDRRLPQPRRAR